MSNLHRGCKSKIYGDINWMIIRVIDSLQEAYRRCKNLNSTEEFVEGVWAFRHEKVKNFHFDLVNHYSLILGDV